MKYDLHVHTNKSDGKYNKYDLLDYLEKEGFEYISFSDHNYIESSDKYNEYIANKQYDIKLINSIEFDIYDYKNMHILGYGIKNIEFVNEKMKENLKENLEICKRLIINLNKNYNFPITYEKLLEYGKPITKSLIREYLVNNGYVKNVHEAGNLYTGHKSLNYEKTKSLSLKETIDLIKESGGISILAHPSTLKMDDDVLINNIKIFKEIGLNGIEVLNLNKTNSKEYELYKKIAKKLDLLESCGSDFHNEITTPKIGVDNDISKKLIYKLGV